MAAQPIPVTTGADGFRTLEAGPFRFIAASFPAGGTIPPHTHDRPCVAVMVAGSFDLGFANGVVHNCGPGTISVEPAGETHCNCMGTAGARVLALQPDPTDETIWRWGRPALDSIAHLRHPGLALLARRMEAEIGCPDTATPLALEGLALELLAGLLRTAGDDRPLRRADWLGEAESMLRARFRETVTVAEVAAEVGVHPSYLTRAFRRRHRVSLGRFVRTLRLEWAARELGATDHSIAAIAVDAGFHDQSHFTRRFREHLGTTPQRWRAAARST